MVIVRKSLFSAAALAGAFVLAASLAGCATPAGPSTPQATAVADGVTRVRLGAATVTMLSDGYGTRQLDAGFVRNASLAEVQAALLEAGLPTDRLTIPYTALVAEVGGQRILFDSGNGEFGAATGGKLLENLGRAGIDPRSIGALVVSHFHGDHINGLRNKAGALVFPNAKVFVPRAEWDWWMDDARMAAAPEAMKGAFAATRRVFGPLAQSVTRFTPGDEVLPGVRSLPAFGHTAGHTAFVIDGGAQKLMYWADTTNVAALFVRNPDWAVVFDADAEAARQSRRRLADKAIAENLLVAGYHLPGSAIGTLSTRGKGYDFVPLKP